MQIYIGLNHWLYIPPMNTNTKLTSYKTKRVSGTINMCRGKKKKQNRIVCFFTRLFGHFYAKVKSLKHINYIINGFVCFLLILGKRYSESLAGTLLPDWIGKSLFKVIICLFNIFF